MPTTKATASAIQSFTNPLAAIGSIRKNAARGDGEGDAYLDFPFKNTRIALRSILTFTSFMIFVAGADFWAKLNNSGGRGSNLIPTMVVLEVMATLVSMGQAVMYFLGRFFTKSTRKLLVIETLLDAGFFLFHLAAIVSLWSTNCDASSSSTSTSSSSSSSCSAGRVITGTIVFNILVWASLTVIDVLSWIQRWRGGATRGDFELPRSSLRYNNI